VFAGELVRAQLACWLQAHVLRPVP
jgi:hypothetical protein